MKSHEWVNGNWVGGGKRISVRALENKRAARLCCDEKNALYLKESPPRALFLIDLYDRFRAQHATSSLPAPRFKSCLFCHSPTPFLPSFVSVVSPSSVFTGLDALHYEEHLDYEVLQATDPALNKAVVRINLFKGHRQTIQWVAFSCTGFFAARWFELRHTHTHSRREETTRCKFRRKRGRAMTNSRTD